MINFLFFKIFLLIYGLIKLSKEIELIDKYSSINLNTEIKNDLRSNLINDYCNVAQSQIVNQLFNIILEEFNSSYIRNDKCFILDNIFNNYYSKFDKILQFNKNSFLYYTCPLCQKDFKTNSLLNLHYKLFHMKLDESLICPGDFCLSVNCNKYYEFFNIKKYSKEPGDVKFNRQPIEKDEKCIDDLIFFYKRNCMKLIEQCFGDDKNKYYEYYKYLCKGINCNTFKEEQITEESDVGDIFRYILMFVFGILCFIYLLILWLNKYT